MEPSSKDPLVRRRTVITLGSAGRAVHPEPDSTSEVLETVSGRISITVKNLPAAKLVDEHEEPTRDDPCWITIRHVDSPAPPAVPLRKSVSACEMKPIFKMKLGNESKILRLAEQGMFKKRPAPPIPSSEPAPVQKSDSAPNNKDHSGAEVKLADNHVQPPSQCAVKTQDKVPSIPYSEWLKTQDPPDEKPRVSFDHNYPGEALKPPPLIAEREVLDEPRIEVIETDKGNVPKSILKNVRRNSDAASFASSRPPSDAEPDKVLAWKMEYHQREAFVGSRLRALVARADEFFINHQNSSRLFPVSPFHLPDIEPLKLPLSADDDSCDSSASSSVESFPELKFNTSTSSEESGKTKRRDPTPEVTKDSSSSKESAAHRQHQVSDPYYSTPDKITDRRNSIASSNDLSSRRHSNTIPNPNHSFKPITSPIHPVQDERLVKDTARRTLDGGLKSGMSIDKATEIVRQFFQSEPAGSTRSSPATVPALQPKNWSRSESSLLADEPSASAAPSSSSSVSADVSPPTSAPSSCVSQQAERGRPQMRSRIPVRVSRPTSTACVNYNRSMSLCNNQSPANSSQARANSVGSRRIWSSSSAITLMTSNNTTAHYYQTPRQS